MTTGHEKRSVGFSPLSLPHGIPDSSLGLRSLHMVLHLVDGRPPREARQCPPWRMLNPQGPRLQMIPKATDTRSDITEARSQI